MYLTLSLILLQTKVSGFQQIAELNPIFGILVSIILVLSGVIILLYNQKQRQFKKHLEDIQQLNKDHIKDLDVIHKNHARDLEDIHKENNNREDERNRIWRESEKETLNVLNGVTSILEMSEKMKVNDTQRILDEINNLKQDIKNK